MGLINADATEYVVIHTEHGDVVVPTDDGLVPDDDIDVNTAEELGL